MKSIANKLMSNEKLLKMINKAKQNVKISDAWIEACKEHEVDPNIISYIPMMFGELDVSATTKKGIVILNNKLIEDFENNESYVLHECVHMLQQCFSNKPTKSSEGDNYLDDKNEQEAFQYQAKFISDEVDDQKSDVSTLVDYCQHSESKNNNEKYNKKTVNISEQNNNKSKDQKDDKSGEKKAEEYVEDLLDHHDVNSSSERRRKRTLLLSKV